MRRPEAGAHRACNLMRTRSRLLLNLSDPSPIKNVVVVRNVRKGSRAADRSTVGPSVADIAAFLHDTLGQALVAFMVGVEDPETIGRWAAGVELATDREAERKLRGAYQVFRLVLEKESPHTVRAWFVGVNPQLVGGAPAIAIREGRIRDVLVAARPCLGPSGRLEWRSNS